MQILPRNVRTQRRLKIARIDFDHALGQSTFCLANDDGKWPGGQITKNLSSPVDKNIPLNASGKSPLQARPVPPEKGADRESSRTSGGMRWTRQRRARNGIAGRVFP